MSDPTPPDDLADDGRGVQFWRRIVAEFEVSHAEREVLVEVARALDELEALRAAVTRDGTVVEGSRGQLVSHPALTELRQGRAELRRLLSQLGADETSDADHPSGQVAQERGRKAARARWANRVGTTVDRVVP